MNWTHEENPKVKGQFICWNLGTGQIREAPKLWNRECDSFLQSLGFISSAADSCLYSRPADNEFLLIRLLMYVHDFSIASIHRACGVTELGKLFNSSEFSGFILAEYSANRYFHLAWAV